MQAWLVALLATELRAVRSAKVLRKASNSVSSAYSCSSFLHGDGRCYSCSSFLHRDGSCYSCSSFLHRDAVSHDRTTMRALSVLLSCSGRALFFALVESQNVQHQRFEHAMLDCPGPVRSSTVRPRLAWAPRPIYWPARPLVGLKCIDCTSALTTAP